MVGVGESEGASVGSTAATGDDLISPEGLRRFNWGAFLLPPIWGVAHGLWAGVFFLPLWAFVDNAFRASATQPSWVRLGAWVAAAVTLAFQAEYARTATRLAWRRVSGRVSPQVFLKRQRWWGLSAAATVAVLAAAVAVQLGR